MVPIKNEVDEGGCLVIHHRWMMQKSFAITCSMQFLMKLHAMSSPATHNFVPSFPSMIFSTKNQTTITFIALMEPLIIFFNMKAFLKAVLSAQS
jgi:hypothetical protein